MCIRDRYYISQEEKDYKKAVEYSNKLWFYQDSIGKTDRNKALVKMIVSK